MNRSYIPENQYRANRVSVNPAKASAEAPRGVEAVLAFFDLLLGLFASPSVRKTLRVFGAVVCFFAFLFVIGAVEVGTLTFGAGVLASFLLFGVAFFCVYRPKKK